MKKAILIALLFTLPAMAKDLNCRAADSSNMNRKAVAVTTVAGAELVEPKVTQYNGYSIKVVYNTGDRYESQTVLSLTANGMSARTYNVSQRGLYQLLASGLFLQCWFE